nr:hypothetical protein [Tanacetum cinerariifolium]
MLFNNTIKWIEAFVPMDTELVKGSEKAIEGSKKAQEDSSKRTAEELEQEDAKRSTKKGGKSISKLSEQMNMVYYLLVEKDYPFTRNILQQMWNDVRLQVDYKVEMAYDLLRLIMRQINKGYVPE